MSDSSRMQAYYRKQPRMSYEDAASARLESRAEQYRAIRERQECPHGRVRQVGMSDQAPWAGMACREGRCPVIYLSAAAVFSQWRDEDHGA